jgi:GNAT superfamily N-acetyltransferase
LAVISQPVVTAGAVYPDEMKCQVRLADGSLAALRPIRSDDGDRLMEFHEHLSGETVYRRFFNAHPHLRPTEIQRFTHVDYQNRLALIAEVGGQLSAVGRYDRVPNTDQAEVAFVVADVLQGHGLGSLLLEHLAVAARRRGVGTFVAHTLGTNYPMQNVFRHAGFICSQRWADGVVEVSFPIAPTQSYLRALIERDLESVRPRLARVATSGSGGLGVACRTMASAETVSSACRLAGLEVSTVLATEELGLSANDSLLYLAFAGDTDVVVIELPGPKQLRRCVALAREGARERPIVFLTTAEADTSWCRQAGVDSVHRVGDLVGRLRELALERRAGTWSPSHRGCLVAPPDCDIARARAVLDEARGPGAGHQPSPVRLPPGPTAEVLAAYDITLPPAARPGSARGSGPDGKPALILEEQPGVGLLARTESPLDGTAAGLTALLPLTDRDAADLVEAAPLEDENRGLAADVVLRAARLIDDQADVSQVRIPLCSPRPGETGVEVWTGRRRGTDDDPFVRRC